MAASFFQNRPAHATLPGLWRIARAALLLSLLLPLGCASHTARTNALLERDYQTMTDQDLTIYYYQLQDQIEIVDNSADNPQVSLGFGFGSYGRHSGTGVGLSSNLPQPSAKPGPARTPQSGSPGNAAPRAEPASVTNAATPATGAAGGS